MPFAICRVSDQKLLPRPIKRLGRKVTWADFSDNISLENQFVPFLWPTRKGAESAMKMWQKGGWVTCGSRRGGIKLKDKDHARTEPVCIVEVGFVILTEAADPNTTPLNPNSVLD